MGKKDIWGSKVKNEIRQRIINDLQSGKPRQQILEELSEEYSDKDFLAKLIAWVPSSEDMPKFTKTNNILFGLMVSFGVYQILLKFFFILNCDIKGPGKWGLVPIALIQPVFIFYFSYLVKRMEGYVYTFIVLLGLIGISKSIHADIFSDTAYTISFLFNVLWILTGIIIANSISKRYFPHLRWRINMQDKNGKYILGKKDMGKQ